MRPLTEAIDLDSSRPDPAGLGIARDPPYTRAPRRGMTRRSRCSPRRLGKGDGWVRHGLVRTGVAMKVPAATVRGWLRVMAGLLDATRTRLLQVAQRAGGDIDGAGGAGLPVAATLWPVWARRP